jgi:hypothetical protein
MSKYAQISIVIFILILLGGFLALGFWNVPPPTNSVETQLDDSRFSN